jgi:hypothetical protein
MVDRAPKPPSLAVPLVDKDGRLNQEWYKYLTGGVKFSQNVNSGVALLAQQQAAAEAALAAERAARIVNDAAVQAAAGGGAAMTSNAVAFSGGLSSGATWVTIATVTLTPTGAGGDYSITAYIDGTISGGLSDDGTVDTSFAGNWRIREELTSGGTEYTLDSGTFTVDYAAAVEESEAGIPFTIGPFWTTSFTGLPLTAVLIPANEGAQVDIRLEIQRASGTNEITAPGLSGSMSVVWTA